jgi:hypothetical protein
MRVSRGSLIVRGVASRLARDTQGRTIVVVTTPDVGLPVGTVFVALGNAMPAVSVGVYFLGRSRGRPPTQEERLQLRNTGARSRRTKPVETPDELLDDSAAIEAARREQQTTPGDLIGRAATPLPRQNGSEPRAIAPL